jgi:ubiquinone/menaquinone biosynthesis C-methylase UbiE
VTGFARPVGMVMCRRFYDCYLEVTCGHWEVTSAFCRGAGKVIDEGDLMPPLQPLIRPDLELIRRRYKRLAPLYPIFEWLWLPRGFRRQAVERLGLNPGATVLELGCGTGRNLELLVDAVGPDGEVVGVDWSPHMLARARQLLAANRWRNVTLQVADAALFRLDKPVDGVLFSLSFSVMPNREEALRLAWAELQPGGRIVIFDGKTPEGPVGRLFHPLALWTSYLTVLGDPDVRAWDSLRLLGARVAMEDLAFGSYFICSGAKPQGREGTV